MEWMLFFVILAQLAYICWTEYQNRIHFRRLVELVKANSLEDVVAAEVIRHDIQTPPTPPVPGAKAIDQLDQSEFDTHIKTVNHA